MTAFDLSVYLVLDRGLCGDLGMVETARQAAAGGATLIQLRDKGAGLEAMVETGLKLKQALEGSGVPLIVNDDVEAAIRIGADGVHVGQRDLPAAEVRQRIGPDMILGLSIGSPEEAALIDPDIVDYVGVGPVFPTDTKPGHPPAIGFEGLGSVARACAVPVVAIGGIKRPHVGPALAAGADGVAIVSAICGQPDPQEAARGLADAVREARR